MQRDAQASGADLQYHRRMAGLLGERAQTKAKAKPIPACDLFAAWKKASAHSGSPGYEERVRSVCAEFGRFAEGQGIEGRAFSAVQALQLPGLPGTISFKSRLP